MKKLSFWLGLFGIFAFLAAGCDALKAIAPPPLPTIAPTPVTVINTPTPMPTFGVLEFLNAGFCRESHIDTNEYNLLRFYRSGVVLDLLVQGYASCQEAWDKTAPYLGETKVDIFNHGEYQFDGRQIQFTLAAAKTNKVIGVVTGVYEGEKMLLKRQGADTWEYILIFEGK